MRISHVAVVALCLLAAGCLPRSKGHETLAKVADGEMAAVHEAGEFARTLVPTTRVPPSPPDVEQVYEALEPHLSADDPYLRLRALESIRRLATRTRAIYRDKFDGLLDPLLADDDPQIRWRAAWSLGRLLLTSEALRQAALDPHERVAERAIWALGEARDEKAVPILMQALDREPLQANVMRALRRTTGLRLKEPDAWRAAMAPKDGEEPEEPEDSEAPEEPKTPPASQPSDDE